MVRSIPAAANTYQVDHSGFHQDQVDWWYLPSRFPPGQVHWWFQSVLFPPGLGPVRLVVRALGPVKHVMVNVDAVLDVVSAEVDVQSITFEHLRIILVAIGKVLLEGEWRGRFRRRSTTVRSWVGGVGEDVSVV